MLREEVPQLDRCRDRQPLGIVGTARIGAVGLGAPLRVVEPAGPRDPVLALIHVVIAVDMFVGHGNLAAVVEREVLGERQARVRGESEPVGPGVCEAVAENDDLLDRRLVLCLRRTGDRHQAHDREGARQSMHRPNSHRVATFQSGSSSAMNTSPHGEASIPIRTGRGWMERTADQGRCTRRKRKVGEIRELAYQAVTSMGVPSGIAMIAS